MAPGIAITTISTIFIGTGVFGSAGAPLEYPHFEDVAERRAIRQVYEVALVSLFSEWPARVPYPASLQGKYENFHVKLYGDDSSNFEERDEPGSSDDSSLYFDWSADKPDQSTNESYWHFGE